MFFILNQNYQQRGPKDNFFGEHDVLQDETGI